MMSEEKTGFDNCIIIPSFLCLSQESIPLALTKLQMFFLDARGAEWIPVTSTGMKSTGINPYRECAKC